MFIQQKIVIVCQTIANINKVYKLRSTQLTNKNEPFLAQWINKSN